MTTPRAPTSAWPQQPNASPAPLPASRTRSSLCSRWKPTAAPAPPVSAHTSGVSDPTSAQAMARLGAQEWREDLRDHLDDWVHTSDLFLSRVEDAIHWATSLLGLPVAPLAPVVLCSGEGYDGRELPWTPHSQDPRNGWHDPNCRDIATLRAGQQLKGATDA